MLLKDVHIQNFKGIDHWNLEFRPGFNLIKGINGTGKTSILEALAVGLGGYVAGIDGVATRHISKDEIRRMYLSTGDGSYITQYQFPVKIEMHTELNGMAVRWERSCSSLQSSRSTIHPRDIAQYAEHMSNDPAQTIPVICYHGTGRVWAQKHTKAEIVSNRYNRTVGYTDALQDASSNRLLMNWCIKMEQVGWQKGTKIGEYEAVKKAVADFIGYMENTTDNEVFYDKQLEDLMIRQGNVVLSINCMSAGFQSLLWMVFDIACRMAMLNPFLRDQINTTPGIVLIDEIDMHLHPKWQWRVIDALRCTFPNVQFIAATHAPILFSSSKDVWLIDIEQENIQYSYSHYGLDVSSAIEQFQGDYILPEPVNNAVEMFYEAMDKEDYIRAKQELEYLEESTYPVFPLIATLRTRYELETGLIGEP